jgi:hypothetical protein
LESQKRVNRDEWSTGHLPMRPDLSTWWLGLVDLGQMTEVGDSMHVSAPDVDEDVGDKWIISTRKMSNGAGMPGQGDPTKRNGILRSVGA